VDVFDRISICITNLRYTFSSRTKKQLSDIGLIRYPTSTIGLATLDFRYIPIAIGLINIYRTNNGQFLTNVFVILATFFVKLLVAITHVTAFAGIYSVLLASLLFDILRFPVVPCVLFASIMFLFIIIQE
jgi:hypothetical protein